MTPKELIHSREGEARLEHRHRLWGIGVPATDLDLVMVEFDRGVVEAIIEYKGGLDRQTTDGEKWSLRAIRDLAERAGVPAFVVKWASEPWRFRVYPLSDYGRGCMPDGEPEQIYSEREFVDFLYRLRGGRRAPEGIRAALDAAA